MNLGDRTSISKQSVSPLTYIAIVLCVVACCVLLTNVRGEEPTVSLTVPVIGASPAPVNDNPQMSGMDSIGEESDQPTLPGGKLPQYQLGSGLPAVETNEQIENQTLRFLLALPAEPILIEAHITIDGEAFRAKREQRVRSTLQAALQPPEEKEPEIIPLRAEKPATVLAEGDAETDPEEMTPSVPGYQSAASIVEKLRRYISSIGREPSLDEVRWFFIDRLEGPTLLLLNDNFQAFRADETPIFHILDRNRDHIISSTEIGQAMESFLDCDLNRNQVVDYLEINEAANDPRLRSESLLGTSALLYLLPTETTAIETYANLLSRYDTLQQPIASLPTRFDADSNGRWDPDELEQLHTMPADITLHVRFDSTASVNSSLSLSEESLQVLQQHELSTEIINSSIVVFRPDCELWLSAIQLQPGDQVSLGAVTDGYPMLPVLDPNDDGRFTIRELRGMTKAIQQFDVNGDGQILKEELRPTIRVSFGLGSSVHQALAGVRKVHPAGSRTIAGPDWFVRMDRNQDRDLSREEFPGTDEQFAQLDDDGDKLISAEEALKYDRKNNPEQPEENKTESNESKKDTTQSEEAQTNSDN